MDFQGKILRPLLKKTINDNQKIELATDNALNNYISKKKSLLKQKHPALSGEIDCIITICPKARKKEKLFSTAIIKTVFIKSSDITNLLFRNEFINLLKNIEFDFKIPADKFFRTNRVIRF